MTSVSFPNGLSPDQALLKTLFAESASRHKHLCPRQVLGVRIGLKGLQSLGFIDREYRPRYSNGNKRLLTISESDGCGSDGLAVATDCSIGHRTLRVLDFGKIAATFVDTETRQAFRVAPAEEARSIALACQPGIESRWQAYLEAYQVMADDELVVVRAVQLNQSLDELLSKPEARAICDSCSEEIFNEREVIRDGSVLCRGCAGESYFMLC